MTAQATSERGEDFDQKREAYVAARAELARLYDSPDKTISIQMYRGRLRRAQNAVLETHREWLAVGEWPTCPPPTESAKPHCPDCSGIVGETGIA